MLKHAYQLGVQLALEDAGLVKEAGLLGSTLAGAGIGGLGGAMFGDEGGALRGAMLGAGAGAGSHLGARALLGKGGMKTVADAARAGRQVARSGGLANPAESALLESGMKLLPKHTAGGFAGGAAGLGAGYGASRLLPTPQQQ